MRVAWIKMGGFWPLNTGGRQRSFQMLSELARRHQVTVLTTHGPGDEPDELARRLAHAEDVISLPYDVPKVGTRRFLAALARSWMSTYPVDLWKWRVPAFRRRLAGLMAATPFDVLVVDFLFSEANLPSSRAIPRVYFAHNVEHQIWKRLAGVETRRARRALLEIEWRKLRRAEHRVVRTTEVTVAVSESDREQFARAVPGAQVDLVPTGVDTTFFAPMHRPTLPERLVFSGSMDWYPNEDAIRYFAERIWPRLRAARPRLSMTVVGRNPGAGLLEAARAQGITVTGTVKDVRRYIDEAAVYVVPLRVGGGTRLKVFEALAMGKPVVSTTLGAEGLGLVSGEHYVAADGDEPFAQAVLNLLGDADARRSLGAAGRAFVEERYSWQRVSQVFEGSLERAVRSRHAPGEFAEDRLAVPSR
jgi:polysaccharide biosynthesis protein PslH